MMKLSFAVVSAALIVAPALATPARDTPITGQDILNTCHEHSADFCAGYIDAVGRANLQRMMHRSCPPRMMYSDAYTLEVLTFLREHRARLREPAASLLWAVEVQNNPCRDAPPRP